MLWMPALPSKRHHHEQHGWLQYLLCACSPALSHLLRQCAAVREQLLAAARATAQLHADIMPKQCMLIATESGPMPYTLQMGQLTIRACQPSMIYRRTWTMMSGATATALVWRVSSFTSRGMLACCSPAICAPSRSCGRCAEHSMQAATLRIWAAQLQLRVRAKARATEAPTPPQRKLHGRSSCMHARCASSSVGQECMQRVSVEYMGLEPVTGPQQFIWPPEWFGPSGGLKGHRCHLITRSWTHRASCSSLPQEL